MRTSEEKTVSAEAEDSARGEACGFERRVLATAAEAYFARHGEYPHDVDALIDEGLVRERPRSVVFHRAGSSYRIALTPEGRDDPGCLRSTAATGLDAGADD